MNDDLDDLKAMMTDVTPKPDAQRKVENLALAQRNFDVLHCETPAPAPRGVWSKLSTLFDGMMSKGVVTSASVVVAGVFLVSPIGQDLWRTPSPPKATAENIAIDAIQTTKTQIASEADAEAMGETADLNARIAPQAAAPQAATRQAVSTYGAALADEAVEFSLGTTAGPQTIGNGNQTLTTASVPISMFSPVLRSDALSALEATIFLDERLPSPSDVQIEDLLNSVTFAYPAPETGAIQSAITVLPSPWNDQTQLVHIGITAGDAAVLDPLGRIAWQSDAVTSYRLIGYEGIDEANAPIENQYGSVPAGRSATAIYEITVREAVDPTRQILGTLSLRYVDQQTGAQVVAEQLLMRGKTVQNHVRTAVAIAGFGQLLRSDPTMGDWTYQDALDALIASTSVKINGDPRQALPPPELPRLLSLFSAARRLSEEN